MHNFHLVILGCALLITAGWRIGRQELVVVHRAIVVDPNTKACQRIRRTFG